MIRFGDVYVTESEIAAIYPSKSEEDKIWVALKSGRMIYCNVDMLQAERVMVAAGLALLDEVEPGDMVLIVLENLAAAGFRYLARDENGGLYAFEEAPERGDRCWNTTAGRIAGVPEPVFQKDIVWDDPEPADVMMMLDEARQNRWLFV